MAGYVDDLLAWPVMLQLSACVAEELDRRGLPGLCRNSPVPGSIAVIDACGQCKGGNCTGIGWVRLVTEYPSIDFPTPVAENATCSSPMAFTVEIGIARCLPVGTTSALSGYVAPTESQQIEATRLQMADKAAIRAAIQCCLEADDRDYTLGGYTPMAAPGDCGGGVWTVTVGSA